MSRSQRWVAAGIVILGFLFRVWALDYKPAHFDEGVNGAFVDSMRTSGAYYYDPGNFHGPLHFYVLFAGQQLFGRSLWVLRMSTVLIGTGVLILMLSFRRFLPFRAVAFAAAFAALSPAMVFYSRYAIHEMWLPFFALLACYGGCGIARGERRRTDLWCLGLGLTGMMLTKETYLLHWIAAVLAWVAMKAVADLDGVVGRPPRPAELFSGSGRVEPLSSEASIPSFQPTDTTRVVGTCFGLLIAFYSGFGFHWEGVVGMLETFIHMFAKGTHGEEGHNKEMLYWVKLMAYYEWPALAGFLLAPFLALPKSTHLGAVLAILGVMLIGNDVITLQRMAEDSRPADFLRPNIGLTTSGSIGLIAVFSGLGFFFARPQNGFVRWLAFYGLASFAAYALIPYKTPWCSINFLWPLFFLVGWTIDQLWIPRVRLLIGGAALLLGAGSFALAFHLNYRNPADDALQPTREDQPDGARYAYVQTTFDIQKLLVPVRNLVRESPRHLQMQGVVLGDAFPLIWELNDFPNIAFHEIDVVLPGYDADFLIIPESRREEIEPKLVGIYFRESYLARGGAEEGWLYLQVARFASEFPGRSPDVKPRIPQRPEQ